MTNKEKFYNLIEGKDDSILQDVKDRIKNRAMLRESQNIALKVLAKLDELHMTQIGLANMLGVSPQQVHKIVSGKENLTIQTQITLQTILDIPILASYYEAKEKTNIYHLNFEKSLQIKNEENENLIGDYDTDKNQTLIYNHIFSKEEYSDQLMKA
jgi:plasmid maintenance system antidote protein VapI